MALPVPPMQLLSPRFLRLEDRVWDEPHRRFRTIDGMLTFDGDLIVTFVDGGSAHVEAGVAVRVAVNRQLADEWMASRDKVAHGKRKS